jgi:hypothetical protein
MRSRTTKDVIALVDQVLGEHDPRIDHAAIAMLRSGWWDTVPRCDPNEPRGHMVQRRKYTRPAHFIGNQFSGEIPWR